MVKNIDEKARKKKIRNLIKLKSSEEIYMFLNNNKDLEESDIARLINVLCMQKDMYYICKTCKIITINGNNLSNLIDIVIEVKNVSYIKELLTTMQNRNYSINKICFLKDPYLIYEILSYSSSFIGNENVNKMINKLCEMKEYRYMVKAGSIEKLSSQNVIKLVDTLIASGKVLELVEFANVCKILPESKFDEIINIVLNSNHVSSMYTLAKIYYDRYNKINKKLVTEILNSKEIKYICLVALYIDNKLIYKLFNNVNSMYQYMCGSGYYSTKELSKITDTIYGENYTNGNIESEKKRLLKVVDKINY